LFLLGHRSTKTKEIYAPIANRAFIEIKRFTILVL